MAVHLFNEFRYFSYRDAVAIELDDGRFQVVCGPLAVRQRVCY